MNIEDVDKMIAALQKLKTELEKDRAKCPACGMYITLASDNLLGYPLPNICLLPVTNQYTGQSGNIEFCSRSCQSSFEDTYVRYK